MFSWTAVAVTLILLLPSSMSVFLFAWAELLPWCFNFYLLCPSCYFPKPLHCVLTNLIRCLAATALWVFLSIFKCFGLPTVLMTVLEMQGQMGLRKMSSYAPRAWHALVLFSPKVIFLSSLCSKSACQWGTPWYLFYKKLSFPGKLGREFFENFSTTHLWFWSWSIFYFG